MKANTQKFITAYQTIDSVINTEVIGKIARVANEREVKKLQSIINTCGAKISEQEFEFIASEMCCDWEDFLNTYIN